MRENNQHYWLYAIGAFTALTGIIITSRLLKQKSFVNKLVAFIQKWEGGLSRARTDTASHYPAPWRYKGTTGWHTNKGVTYQTFVGLASKVGYAITPKNFFAMSNKLWMKILFEGYMKPYPLERISHLPKIQAVIITWAWGSGLGGSEWRLARFQRDKMKIKDSNITKAEIVENFRARINKFNENKWFHLLCDRRAEDFKKMSTFPANGRGWLRRLTDFRKTFG